MDEVISKGKGKLRAMKAQLGGLTGVWKTLAEQHGEAAALLERARDNPTKRDELWPTIRSELLSHERGELREVYPVLRQHADLRVLAERHDIQAKDMEQIVLRLDGMSPQSDAWQSLYNDLVSSVQAHAEEEETDIFPIAQQVLGDEVSRDLDAKFRRAKQEVAAQV